MKSTNINLQFLEAQLNEYLHSHETDDVAKKLWVTPRGFRMPYRRERWSLHNNMKFIERQLEEYLHEHEVSSSTATTHENWTSTWDAAGTSWASLHGDESGEDDQRHAQLMQLSAGDTITEVRLRLAQITEVEGDNVFVEVRDGATIAGSTLLATSGKVSTSTLQLTGSVTSDPVVTFTFTTNPTLTSSSGWIVLRRDIASNNSPVVRQVELTAFQDMWSFGSSDSWVQDYVDESMQFSVSYIPAQSVSYEYVGFRFPYQDYDSPGSLELNMKFLETQISQYLHKHEVGYVAPPEE